MDIIFGTFATDELKLVHHRAKRRGLQHNFEINPRDPKPGEAVMLSVTTGPDFNPETVIACYTTDGSLPVTERDTAHNGSIIVFNRDSIEWDSFVWGYVQHWSATLPPQPDGTLVRYQISGWNSDTPEHYADNPDSKLAAEAAAAAFFAEQTLPDNHYSMDAGQTPRTFAYHVDTYTPPAWAYDAIIYQIFVDRFYPGNGKSWLQTAELDGICGGTLWGVVEKLDYIAELGANCIWLSPTWVSPSHHGYDALDYQQTEPRLGGDEALRGLINAAHERGIRVLLDLVCNHVSNKHPIFLSALNDPASPYRDWFYFDTTRKFGYRAFFDVKTMPELNLANPETREWMLDIARYWLEEFDIDGYRLDYANGPGPEFWAEFQKACKAIKPDSLCFGEIIDAPDAVQAYQGVLDGCLDFHLSDAIRRTFGWQSMSLADLDTFRERHAACFDQHTFIMPTFLDNHDMDRLIYVAGGHQAALMAAAEYQMQLPSPPIIYYGTEVGLSQEHSTRDGFGQHISRTPMLWGDEQDQQLLAFYKALIQQRKQAVLMGR
ncbi:MAG: alpha-amylase [Chloroflexi bacterium]|nr:alpha-amylase [Chloroflexota bacterium]